MQISRNVFLRNYHDKLYKVHLLKFDLNKKDEIFLKFDFKVESLLDVVFICRCPFIDERKYSEMDRPLFVLKEKRKENDKKSNHSLDMILFQKKNKSPTRSLVRKISEHLHRSNWSLEIDKSNDT